MNKIERDGKVAVLISRGYGAGWSSWSSDHAETLCMDAEIVQAVLDGDMDLAVKVAKSKCGDFYEGGIDGLCVEWVTKGSIFEVEEYDGAESLHVIGGREYLVA